MVMIPSDVGVRMRLQTEASLHPVAPVAEISADLADFHSGQVFSARIQEVLPENTYKALVSGRTLTLALPEGAKAGDTLELVVVDRTPRSIVAKLANPSGLLEGGTGELGQFTTLSRAAQVIGALLARDGDTPVPASLNRGQPLLTTPLLASAGTATGSQQLAAQLAPQLAKAVSESGLFYESHQVQWMQGQRPLTSLLAEPQAAYSRLETLAAYRQPAAPEAAQNVARDTGTPSILQALFGTEDTRPASNALPQSSPNTPAQAIPEELRPLVQQQLDAAATQRLAWHGEVWPGQEMHWEIEADDRHTNDGDANPERGWNTSLRLTMPRLGGIDASIRLTAKGVSIAIATPLEESASSLRDAAPALGSALASAGIPLLAIQVSNAEVA